jgi:hypothetical protein
MILRLIRSLTHFRGLDQPAPRWLQKQVDGCLLMGTDVARGIALLVDGMQDELDLLDEAEAYGNYPG